ncbi:ABC transporter substrate-binding protein [Bosea sp. BK604]|uniref:ABC transporter substrate-binding protein n=1 Tax=Bosea sp. BK604 TaxID=2512180 RepID=UPI001052998D|nr:ABC transporter substrate-binding protein [Bosea sp. BK604]TCR62195.1 peptide/nickel transport system substrate-binding protein [Bosea sp. BK604]
MPTRRAFMAGGAAALAISKPSISLAADKRVVKFVPQGDLAVVDPIWTTATVTRNHAFLVYDTLFGQDESYRAQPQMAAGATSVADGKVWTITLRDGLKFHDGAPVLARDCVASLKRWGKRDSFGQTLMGVTDELSAVDDKTLRFRLKQAFPLLPDALAKMTAFVPAIMPERLANIDAFTQINEVVGSGPFRFVASERQSGSRAVYEKFAGYVPRSDGKPGRTAGPKIVHFERVEWHTLPDPATAAAALQSGEIDWVEQPIPDMLPILAKNPDIAVEIKETTGSIAIMRMNHLHPPFDNPAIRRAILLAVNQADFMEAVGGPDKKLWRTGVGVFPPDTPMAGDAGMEVLNSPRDLAKAKQSLAEAGYKGEKVVVLGVSDLANLKAECEVGADMLTRLGMNVDYQVMDWGTVVTRRAKKEPPGQGGWNVFYTGWNGIDILDPVGHLSIRGNGSAAWPGWPEAPKIEALRDAWMAAPDLAAQQKIAAEIQKQVMVDVPYIPLGQYFQPVGYRRTLEGVLPSFPTFWNVKRAG